MKERCGEDGQRLVVALEAIAFGNAEDHRVVFGLKRGLRVTVRERREAISELLDRGWGKARQSLDVGTKDPRPLFAFPQGTLVDIGHGIKIDVGVAPPQVPSKVALPGAVPTATLPGAPSDGRSRGGERI